MRATTVMIESTIYPAWPWRVADVETGQTLKLFRSDVDAERWVKRHGYRFPASDVARVIEYLRVAALTSHEREG